jgi:Zn-dependent protease with chaperone function
MEFKPGKPQKNYNITDTSPLKEFAVLLSGVSVIVLVLYLLLGLAVDSVVDALPEEWAHASFETPTSFETPIKAENRWQTSKLLEEMLDQLALCADIHHPVNISLIESKEANAFALPNGLIVVFSGLLDVVQSENGLAFVLAHELAHFKNRDHLRQMGRSIILTGFFALLTGDSSGFGEALTPAMMLGNANYSQEREMDADNRAMEILNCHYGHVAGATELFEYYRNNPASMMQNSFLSSHPAPQERIENIETLVQTNGWRLGVIKTLDF